MLGIIGAMDKEVDALREQMRETEEKQVGFTRFTAGKLWGVPVCLARCGIGKVHAALCAQAMILSFPVDALLNIGVAGALRRDLQIADLVIARSAVQHDIDTTPLGDPLGLISGLDIVHIPCDEAWIKLLSQAAEEAGLPAVHASVATGDQFIVGVEKKEALSRAFGAAACDMEGGAIAQCCYEMGVPYAAVRSISDTLAGDEQEYMQKAMKACRAEEKLIRHLMGLILARKEEETHG